MRLSEESRAVCLATFADEVMTLAERCPVEEFKAQAIELLNGYCRFDSAQWVTRARVQDEANRAYLAAAHLHNLPNSKLETYQPYIEKDKLLGHMIAHPNQAFDLRSVWPDEAYFSSELYQQYSSHYGLERLLSILIAREDSNFCQAITLYRQQRDDTFSELERAFFEQCSGWLTRALRMNILEMVGSRLVLGRVAKPRAVLDGDGYIFELDTHLENWLRSQVLNFDGHYFPAVLIEQAQHDGSVAYPYYHLEIVAQGDLNIVYFHCTLPFNRLTKREWEVACSSLDCDGNKSIARRLGNEPGTVQKHLQNIYIKLGINELNDNHEKRRILSLLVADYLRQQTSQSKTAMA